MNSIANFQLKNFFLVMVILVSAFSINAQEFTIATFNAEFLNQSRVYIKFGHQFDIGRETDEVQEFWNKEENRAAKYQEACANVAQFIKEIDADILTLTEVGNAEDLKVLLEELEKIGVNYDYSEVCDCQDSFTQQHVAVLSRYPIKDVWPEIQGRSIYLEEADGDSEDETGISKGMKVTVVVEEVELDIMVLHLKSERGGYDSDAKRIAQATIARRSIVQLLNEGRNVIVTGDLNSEKSSPTIYRIRGFDDIYEELIQTGNSDYFEDSSVRWTYNYRGETEQIDHILISTTLANKSEITTKILETGDEKISDHNPVIVKIVMEEK